MTTENIKNSKFILNFLLVLSIIVLGSFILEHNVFDILYLLFLIYCIIHYKFVSNRK